MNGAELHPDQPDVPAEQDRFEMRPGDKPGCVNGCDAPFGVRCSICNSATPASFRQRIEVALDRADDESTPSWAMNDVGPNTEAMSLAVLDMPEMQAIRVALGRLAVLAPAVNERTLLRRAGLPVHVVDWVLS